MMQGEKWNAETLGVELEEDSEAQSEYIYV